MQCPAGVETHPLEIISPGDMMAKNGRRDPIELWDHDPFEPFIETRPNGSRAIRARGASGDNERGVRSWAKVLHALAQQ